MSAEVSVDSEQGLLRGVRLCSSPNFDPRPAGCQPELIVVHGISLPPGCFGGEWIEALFMNRLDRDADPYFVEVCNLRVSSHVLIQRNGEITQYVPFDQRAWHAGESCYQGRSACNDFSIGIELEGCDTVPYENRQYRRLDEVVRALLSVYPSLSAEHIVGHSDIAPGRKTDPGEAFDWRRFRGMLSEPRLSGAQSNDDDQT